MLGIHTLGSGIVLVKARRFSDCRTTMFSDGKASTVDISLWRKCAGTAATGAMGR